MERKRLSKGHLHSANHRGRDNLGHGKKVTEPGALTNWRPQREGQVKTWKKSD